MTQPIGALLCRPQAPQRPGGWNPIAPLDAALSRASRSWSRGDAAQPRPRHCSSGTVTEHPDHVPPSPFPHRDRPSSVTPSPRSEDDVGCSIRPPASSSTLQCIESPTTSRRALSLPTAALAWNLSAHPRQRTKLQQSPGTRAARSHPRHNCRCCPAQDAQASKLAPNPFRRWRPGPGSLRPPRPLPHPHPRHRLSLLRYLFPQFLRDRYREKLFAFHLDTLPRIKQRLQSRIYRYILARQRKRLESRRLVDIVRRHGRRLLLGPQKAAAVAYRQPRQARGRGGGGPTATTSTTNTLGLGRRDGRMLPGFGGGAGAGYGGSGNSYGASDPSTVQPNAGERGYRRKKLAAMANNVYKAGATAVNEIREGYAHIPRAGENEDGHAKTTIPGSFPDVAITVQGDDQMVLFPSYAKRHVKQDWSQMPEPSMATQQGSIKDEDYWRREWERDQDEKAIVDVDVRGWIYSPHKGPMTRRNRVLIGLARQLSGIPAPRADVRPGAGDFVLMQEAGEDRREQEQVAKKAAEIESKGQEEKRVAYHGGYSEPPDGYNGNTYNPGSRPASIASAPNSPKMTAKQYTNASELTDAELAVANANLLARIAPFMTTPLVQLPVTIFFYNDSESASRTVQTDDAGHFVTRAALEFVPTHVRVLANSDLSATQEIKIIEPRGVSLISDIDDTIKRSNISSGAKEIFRNTFIRELHDLTIGGVKEWYGKMHDMGVSIHYCSNSPWQLFPVLASYFMIAGLPPGSLHLKQYSGMLQGIFEPVAERKRSTLFRLMKDFPERKFLLVGDSGEADLEVYTELVTHHPGRVIAVFIRDVTTPEETGYFSSSFDTGSTQGARLHDASDHVSNRPSLPPRGEAKTTGPTMGDLIDLSDEPQQAKVDHLPMLSELSMDQPRRTHSTTDLAGRKAPPPRPAKPMSLRSTPSDEDRNGSKTHNSRGVPVPALPPSRKPVQPINNSANDLLRNARMPAGPPRRDSGGSLASRTSSAGPNGKGFAAPPPPPPRRRDAPPSRRPSGNEDVEYDPLPGPSQRKASYPGSYPAPSPVPPRRAATVSSSGTSPTLSGQGPAAATAQDRKVELWKRRLQRAHEVLDAQGVMLYTWRRGEDVVKVAVGMVEHATRGRQGEKRATEAGARFEREARRDQGR